MNYQPLADVKKSFRVKWYRSKIDGKTLKALSQRSDAQGWFQAGGHIALAVFTGSLIFWFWTQQLWLPMVVALFLHGTIMAFWGGTAPHELEHGSVFRTKWLNKFFLYFFSFFSWWNPFDYGLSHTLHHRYTLHPEGDREVLLPIKPKLASGFMLQMFTVNLWTKRGRTFGRGGLIPTIYETVLGSFGKMGSLTIPSTEWIHALHTDDPDEERKSIWWSRVLLIGHGSIILISILTGLWVLPLIFTFGGFYANWLAYFVALPQHCGLQDNVSDFRKSTRSMKLNPFLEFLYWHMNWHIEHHMYVSVPCYNLKKLHEALADDMPEPRTLIGAWREMRETWSRQQSEPEYQFDTPLPTTATLAQV